MKKTALYYSIIWFVSVALFNVITFVTPSNAGNKFDGSFWVGYIFITVAFVGHYACVMLALARNDIKKTFYNLSLVGVSNTGVIATLIVGTICMAVPFIKSWVAIISCAITLGVNIVAVLKASAAVALVTDTDTRVEREMALMKALIDEARSISLYAAPALQAEAKKVYEALRYSDPTDHVDVAELNWQLKGGLKAFAAAVKKEDSDLAIAEAQNLQELLESRNTQLKSLKH